MESMASVFVDGNNNGRGGGSGGGLVVTELAHIKDLLMQLQLHLGGSHDLCNHLTSKISSITDRSISLLITTSSAAAATPSPLSDANFKPPAKKRKTTHKKRHEVRVSSAGSGGDHPADDGHSWRKYGQKEILGAKHPRAYYRCTHRPSQGCAAVKKVQRADEDPTLFDVVYIGEHTCAPRAAAAQAATDAPEPEHNQAGATSLQSLTSNLTLKTEGLAAEPELPKGWDACFASTPATTYENWAVSPATSDSHHVVPFPLFEVAGDVQLGFQEAMSALVPADDFIDDIDVSSFLA